MTPVLAPASVLGAATDPGASGLLVVLLVLLPFALVGLSVLWAVFRLGGGDRDE